MEARTLVVALLGFIVVCCCLELAAGQNGLELSNCRPPSIKTQGPVKKYFIDKAKIRVPCIAQGDGKLTYTWLKDDKTLDLTSEESKDRMILNGGTGTIIIFHSKPEDEGYYQCVVTNNCGTAMSRKTEVLHALALPFPGVETPPVIKKLIGSSAKLTCTPPQSVPKAKVYWTLSDPNLEGVVNEDDDDPGDDLRVPINNRVTTDYHGNLYITSVRKEDEYDGKTYVCVSENTLIRSSSEGADKILKTMGSTASEAAVEMMWNSEEEILVLESRKAKFKCIFSGTPLPTITWTRVSGGEMDDSRMKNNFNELIIHPVQASDAGEYRCEGTNNLTPKPITKVFKLKVDAAPKWRREPDDQIVGVGESASFECDAVGNPKPDVKWFINGKPYEEMPGNTKRQLRGSTLVFADLEKEDSQVIQCNASNKHGYKWSDVYLYVEALPPSIEEKPQHDLIMAEGQNVTLKCLVTGKPKPTVVWYKGQQALNSDHYQVQEEGHLLIPGVTKKDSGGYRCFAENKFGEAEAEGLLAVREKTKIIQEPIDQDINFQKPVSFTCSASTDVSEIPNLKYYWMKDGRRIETSSHVTVNHGQIDIHVSKSYDSGTYTCIADNGLDKAVAEATLKVKAPPEPPFEVQVNCSGRKAFISWMFSAKMANFDQMTKYLVEMQTQYKPRSWTLARTVDYKEGLNKATVELSPFASYTFRVKAVNKMGVSEPSANTASTCDTPHAVPDKNPTEVRTDEQHTGFLVIKWKPMDQIDLNAPNFSYVITAEEIPGAKQTFYVDNYKIGEKKIEVGNVYRPYRITVQARNQVGSSSKPRMYFGHSGEAAPLVVPANFELDPDVNVTATSAGFRWDPVKNDPALIRGKFIGYKIRYWKKGQQATTMHEEFIPDTGFSGRITRDVSSNKIKGIVQDLPSYSEIEADVVTSNNNFASNGSNIVNFTTPEGVPGPVRSMVALTRGSNHFQVEWTPPKEPNGKITGYQLSYQEINRLDFGELKTPHDNLDPEVTRTLFKGLKEKTQYRVYIRARTAIGLGKDYFIDITTSDDGFALATPKIVKHAAEDNGINVTFSVPLNEAGSRVSNKYYLEHKKKGAKKWTTADEPVTGEGWGRLDHLDPGTLYMVRVVAMEDKAGKRSPSNFELMRTTGEGRAILKRTARQAVDNAAANSTSNVTIPGNVTTETTTMKEEPTLGGASRASFLTAAWFIGMMVAIAILILILIIVCILKRNRGDHYPVQEKERLRGNCDDTPDNFNGFGGKGDENGFGGSSSFDRDGEKAPLDADEDSLDYGDDDGSKFNEDGSFIGLYGDKAGSTVHVNASSVV